MWSGPRNVSTALMYSFAQRSDARVVDEPLYGHYLHVTGAEHPGRETVLQTMDLDGRRVMHELATGPLDRDVLFAKQMAHHWIELEADLLRPFEHFLLIRDPREMLPSLAEVLHAVTLRDTGLPDQARLLECLLAEGKEPFCVDSRDLLSDPGRVLSEVCRRLGFEFEPCMLEWEPGPRPEDGVWAQWWYSNVHRSVGFQPWRPTGKVLDQDQEALLGACLEIYGRLYEYRIRD
jgi:hypothetical protein